MTILISTNLAIKHSMRKTNITFLMNHLNSDKYYTFLDIVLKITELNILDCYIFGKNLDCLKNT